MGYIAYVNTHPVKAVASCGTEKVKARVSICFGGSESFKSNFKTICVTPSQRTPNLSEEPTIEATAQFKVNFGPNIFFLHMSQNTKTIAVLPRVINGSSQICGSRPSEKAISVATEPIENPLQNPQVNTDIIKNKLTKEPTTSWLTGLAAPPSAVVR